MSISCQKGVKINTYNVTQKGHHEKFMTTAEIKELQMQFSI